MDTRDLESRMPAFAKRTALFVSLGLLALALTAANAKADGTGTVTLTGSGVWGSGAPISSWSAPGDTWSFSFTLPAPTPGSPAAGDNVVLVSSILNFSFALNGAPVSIPAADVVFFEAAQLGGFQIDFNSGTDTSNGITCAPGNTCSFDVFGSQLFTGKPPTINIVPGSATTVDLDYTASNGLDTTNPAGTGTFTSPLTVTTTASTPEPATLSLLLLGGLGLFAKLRKK